MKKKKEFELQTSRRKQDSFQVMALIICVLLALVCFYPMYYVLIMSISDPLYAIKGVYLAPVGFYLDSYKKILADMEMWNGLKMSLFYVVTGTVGMIIMCVLAAYPLTRKDLKFRKLVVIYLLIPMYFGGGLIPGYLNMIDLKMINTVWALVLPSTISIWNIILVRTYMAGLPHELEEAAFIDGAGHLKVLTMVTLPLSKPVLAVIAIYTIVGIWNSWFAANVYITDYNIHPVQLYLRRVLVGNSHLFSQPDQFSGMDQEMLDQLVRMTMMQTQLRYAVIIVVSLPILLVYPMFQKHFVKGVMMGSLKG